MIPVVLTGPIIVGATLTGLAVGFVIGYLCTKRS